MIARHLLLCLPVLAGSGAGAADEKAPLLLVNAVYPPFVNPAGHPRGEGLDIEIAREALRRVGREIRVELLPWKRVLLQLEIGHADLTTTISRNGDRDRYLLWTQSYRNGASYQFYTRKESPLQLKTLGDLAGRHLGTVQGFYYPEAITGQPGVMIDSARDVAVLAQKLNARRIDVMVVTGIRGALEIREAGLADQLTRQPYVYAAVSPNYMAFSKARIDPGLVAATNAALQRMAADGSMAAIERRYLNDLLP
jgi:polar amino acid transport system substrate-binding protein